MAAWQRAFPRSIAVSVRVTRPMLECTSFEAAPQTSIGIALMHMLCQGQMDDSVGQDLTAATQCYALAASSLPLTGLTHPTLTAREHVRRPLASLTHDVDHVLRGVVQAA